MGAVSPKPAESFAFKDILYSKKDWVATITLHRPDRFNALSTNLLREGAEALLDASFDDGVAVVVLTGSGKDAFCAGGDLKEYVQDYTRRPHDYWKYMAHFKSFMEGLLNVGKPTIARINGICVAGGNEAQLACDLAVMADHAYLGQAGARSGSVAAGGATQWLPLHVGDRRAREILYFCDKIDARKALDWGLVNAIAPYDQLDAKVDEYCRKLIEKFPECLRYTKEQTNFWKNLSWYQTIGHARDWLSTHLASAEPLEGMGAFAQKRKADYLGMRRKAKDGGSPEFVWGPHVRTCPSCKTANLPEEFAFCGRCGHQL